MAVAFAEDQPYLVWAAGDVTVPGGLLWHAPERLIIVTPGVVTAERLENALIIGASEVRCAEMTMYNVVLVNVGTAPEGATRVEVSGLR